MGFMRGSFVSRLKGLLRRRARRERMVAGAQGLAAVGIEVGRDWANRVLGLYGRMPSWVIGAVPPPDGMFLYSIVRGSEARRVAEVGVASGVSSAMILAAVRDGGGELSGESGEEALRSYDVSDRCYFDESRRVGEAAPEMFPELTRSWVLRTGCDAVDASGEIGEGSLDVAFIDGDHRHPWVVIDVLALLGAMREGGWLVLHDVRLEETAAARAARTGEQIDWGYRGARLVYEAWPGPKATAGKFGNIGALRVGGREDRESARDMLMALIRDESWEGDVEKSARRALDRLGVGLGSAG